MADPNDPNRRRLKKARDEILSILKKYDCAGFIVLHRPGWTEQLWDYKPSYSILRGDFPYVHIQSRLKEDFQGDAGKKREHDAWTAEMIHGIATTAAGHAMPLLDLATLLDEKLGAEHQDGPFITEDDAEPDPPQGVH